MGNNPSSSSKSGGTTPTSPTNSQDSPRHHHQHHHRKDVRSIIPHRSAASPETSLAQAQGSTSSTASAAAAGNRPKSLPSTALSSLSGSPLSTTSTPHKARDVPRDVPSHAPSKPVDVPTESTSLRSHHAAQVDAAAEAAAARKLLAEGAVDSLSQLASHSSFTDMYHTRPPRLPLPIEEEVHTPGSPILGPEEGGAVPEVDLAGGSVGAESSDGITRKSSATTVDDEDAQELRVDKDRPLVPTKLEWKRGGEKIYVTGTIFHWNRKHRLQPVYVAPLS